MARPPSRQKFHHRHHLSLQAHQSCSHYNWGIHFRFLSYLICRAKTTVIQYKVTYCETTLGIVTSCVYISTIFVHVLSPG